MNDSKIPVRYAKALFLAAKEGGKLEEINRDVSLLSTSLEDERFMQILESPVVKTSQKIRLIKDVFSGSMDKLSIDFLELILHNKRESYLSAMTRNYKRLYRDNEGIKSAELIVPETVTEIHRKKLLDLLSKVYNSKIEMTDRINPDIIGGFILKVEDEQFDASVSTSLARIKKNLLETTLK